MRNSIKLIARMLPVGALCITLNLIAASAQTMSGGNYKITSSVQASGGGTSSGSGNKVIEGTAGQTAAGGPLANSASGHDAGFWPTTLTQALVMPTPTPTPTPTPSPSPTPMPSPTVSINDVSQAEGNNGITSFTFTVSLSAASAQMVTVNYAAVDNSAQAEGDYQPASGLLSFAPGETLKQISVLVNGDTKEEPTETFFVILSNATNATLANVSGTGTIVNDDSPAGPEFNFSQASYSVQEDLGALTVTITRSGDSSAAASVDYLTGDGSAVQKSDFELAIGKLNFAPGETIRTITILLNEDSYIEGAEDFKVMLSNPNGASLGQTSTATVTILDDPLESMVNPIDDPTAFVFTHYHDFLNREPDPAGLAFWTNQITSCGNDAQCTEQRRINVSASFFLSIEFQQTGYLLYLMQRESYATMPRYTGFMRDLQEIGLDVIVNSPGWQQKLADNQHRFANNWVNRPEFKAAYDALSNDEYVNKLYANAGIVPPQAQKDKLVAGLNTQGMNRSTVLLDVAADAAFRQQQQNAAFVLMQYYGYLRRDPEASPDSDLSGYNFWLNKFNQFGGNYIDAEIIKAFITSFEYRQRFAR